MKSKIVYHVINVRTDHKYYPLHANRCKVRLLRSAVSTFKKVFDYMSLRIVLRKYKE